MKLSHLIFFSSNKPSYRGKCEQAEHWVYTTIDLAQALVMQRQLIRGGQMGMRELPVATHLNASVNTAVSVPLVSEGLERANPLVSRIYQGIQNCRNHQ